MVDAMDAKSGRRGFIFWLFGPIVAVFFVDSVFCFTTRCIQSACNQHNTSTITCNQSLILIVDVTNVKMKRDQSAFEKVKLACMAVASCDPSRICGPRTRKWLLVHYYCVDGRHVQPTLCDGRTVEIQGKSGFIQSPDYPKTTDKYIPCRWQIDISKDSFLTLSVHDLDTSGTGTKDTCDGGIIVSGIDCDENAGNRVSRFLCGGHGLTSLVICGRVTVELSDSKSNYPLRFWLSYNVQSKPRPVSLSASIRSCSGGLYTMQTSNSEVSNGFKKDQVTEGTITNPSSNSDNQNDTQIFITLLIIFCVITLILLIILIIVCIRCRQIRLAVSDHVYSEPSPGLQAHYDYISSLDDEKPRPKLAEEYFEVADALPVDERLPNSPAYAEVEQFAQLKKGQWSSLGSSDWSDAQSDPNAVNIQHAEDVTPKKLTTGTTKSGIIHKIVPDRFTKHSKQKYTLEEVQGLNNSGPKVFVVNLKTAKSRPDQCNQVINKNKDDDNNMYDDSSTYEQIDVYSSKINDAHCTQTDNSGARLSATPQIRKENERRKKDKLNYWKQREEQTRVSNTVKENSPKPSRINQIKKDLLSKKYNGTNERDDDKGNNFKCSSIQEKKSLPHNVMSTSLQKQTGLPTAINRPSEVATREHIYRKKNETDKQSTAKTNLLKDGPRTEGIVKNGIQKFEHNTSM